MSREGSGLRHGWTTGACATAATTAAYTALLTGEFPDPVQIDLPNGQRPSFALAREALAAGAGRPPAIVKDAGDDPDVTHGALVSRRPCGSASRAAGWSSGPGRASARSPSPGLPLAVGEPAINPVPRQMIARARRRGRRRGTAAPATSSSRSRWSTARSSPASTWNPRLGILGGLSILGTTGVVVPYSCSSWIDSHPARRRRRPGGRARSTWPGAPARPRERVVAELYGLPEDALLDMGDFAGAVLKYLRRHPVPRLTVAGGIGKLAKLADGHLDLHSGRSQVSFELARRAGAPAPAASPTLVEAVRGGEHRARRAAACARRPACRWATWWRPAPGRPRSGVLRGAPVEVDVVVIDRAGTIVGRAGCTIAAPASHSRRSGVE